MSLSGLSDEWSQVRTKKKGISESDRSASCRGESGSNSSGRTITKESAAIRPYDLERMLRIYLVQNLYDLSDMATVAEVIDSRAFSEFCGVESSNQVPDGDTLGRFRNLLLRSGLQEKLFAQVVYLLQERGLLLKKGTIVDSSTDCSAVLDKEQGKETRPGSTLGEKGE